MQKPGRNRTSDLGEYAKAPIEFLKLEGASRLTHSGRSLLDHLVGTACILSRWGYSEDVCLAGLFHSVYGTTTYERSLLELSERSRVAKVIGGLAERTAFCFSQMDQGEFWRALSKRERPIWVETEADTTQVGADEIGPLLAIFWANEIEQAAYTSANISPAGLRTLVDTSQPHLSQSAYAEVCKAWRLVPKVICPDQFSGKLYVLNDFYSNIEQIYKFSTACPVRRYTLEYIEGMESVSGYPSQSAMRLVKDVLGIKEILDKTSELSLFGMFRYLLAGTCPNQIGVHVDRQPWTLIVYISPTIDARATGIYRHKPTGVCDLSALDRQQRDEFLREHLDRDRYSMDAWECVHATSFRQNTAILFKAGDLLHSNVSTWGHDIHSARVTQNFNFDVR